MRIRPVLFAALIAGCGSTVPSTTAESTPPALPPASSAPAHVDARPDPPPAAAAARDAELAQLAAGFVDAFTNSAPELSPDGTRVVFISSRDGLPQIYLSEVAVPAAPATRVLATTERVGSVRFTPDGKSLIYSTDVGADEQWTFHRVGLDGKRSVELTPGESLDRDAILFASGVPDTLFFSARLKSDARSTVYATSISRPGPAKPLYRHDGFAMLRRVSPDGKTLFVLDLRSSGDNHVLRVDAATGVADRLFPTEGQAGVHDVEISPDGKRLYVATDGGGEQELVYALDAATGKVLAKHATTPAYARVVGLSAAANGGLLALSLLVGNRSEIRLVDGRTLAAVTTVALPLGSGTAGRFSHDGRQLVADWSTPRAPNDIFSIDTATGKAEPLRREDRPTLAAIPALEVSNVDIPAFDGGVIPTHVLLVKGKETVPRPVLVIYHGGPAFVSTIRWSVVNAFFASLGYVIVEPNVRGSTGYGRAFQAADDGAKRLDAFKDIETTARWTAQQPWADKDRLVVYGGSYGGYTALIALSHWPDIWRAGVDRFGIVNLKTFMETTNGYIRQGYHVELGDPVKDAALYTRLSPLTAVDKIVDPTFVYAGANDPRVPRSESDLIVKALRERKIPSEYMVANDEGHSMSRRHNQLEFYARCARFLEDHLR